MGRVAARLGLMLALAGALVWPGGRVYGGQAAFDAFYATFLQAVAAGDKGKLADMSLFDGFTWEAAGGPVTDRATFLERFPRLFTPAIKKSIASAKPVKVDDDHYFTAWKVRGEEYSLYFARRPDGGFAFLGLTVGPG